MCQKFPDCSPTTRQGPRCFSTSSSVRPSARLSVLRRPFARPPVQQSVRLSALRDPSARPSAVPSAVVHRSDCYPACLCFVVRQLVRLSIRPYVSLRSEVRPPVSRQSHLQLSLYMINHQKKCATAQDEYPLAPNAAGTCSIGTTSENDCLERARDRVEEVIACSLQLEA